MAKKKGKKTPADAPQSLYGIFDHVKPLPEGSDPHFIDSVKKEKATFRLLQSDSKSRRTVGGIIGPHWP